MGSLGFCARLEKTGRTVNVRAGTGGWVPASGRAPSSSGPFRSSRGLAPLPAPLPRAALSLCTAGHLVPLAEKPDPLGASLCSQCTLPPLGTFPVIS